MIATTSTPSIDLIHAQNKLNTDLGEMIANIKPGSTFPAYFRTQRVLAESFNKLHGSVSKERLPDVSRDITNGLTKEVFYYSRPSNQNAGKSVVYYRKDLNDSITGLTSIMEEIDKSLISTGSAIGELQDLTKEHAETNIGLTPFEQNQISHSVRHGPVADIKKLLDEKNLIFNLLQPLTKLALQTKKEDNSTASKEVAKEISDDIFAAVA